MTMRLDDDLEVLRESLRQIDDEKVFAVQDRRNRREGTANRLKPISLAKTLTAMATESLGHSAEAEFFQTVAKLRGESYDPQRVVIPWGLLKRDLTVATASSAGYLVGTETQQAIDILRPWSVTAQAGVTIEMNLVGSQAIPKVTSKTTPAWVTDEATQVTPSQTTLTQVACTPKTVGIVVNVSRQLSLQANAEAFVRRELLRTVGTAIDQAVLNGTGANGQPLGLLNTTGIQTQSGTTLNSGVLTMKQKLAEKDVADLNMAYLGTPAVRALLEGRERTTGGGRFVWQGDRVADRPAYVSTDVPTATLIAGDWSNIYLGLWGPGFVVEINPYDSTGFKTGMIQARILVSCDVAVLHPAGFIAATSIT